MGVRQIEVHQTDDAGRLTLPEGFARTAVLVEVVSPTELVVRKAEAEVTELPPLTTLQPLSDRDRDLFLAAVDDPPPPNEALKRLMSGDKKPQ